MSSGGAQSPVKARGGVIVLAVIVLIGALLRLRLIGNSLFEDELASYFVVDGHSLGQVIHLQYGHSVDLTPPLYHVLAWLWERLGSSRQLLRATSVIAGIGAIALTFSLGARTVGRRAALIGASIVALSPFAVFYSTQARPYALMMALVLVSTIALLRAIADSRAAWWVVYAVASSASVYAHYTAVFALVAQAGWALHRHPASRRPLLVANGCAVLAFLPWLPAVIRESHSFGAKTFAILEPFTAHAVAHDLALWGAGQPWLSLSTVPGSAAAATIVGGIAVAVLGAFSTRAVPDERVALIGLLALATPLGVALYSIVRESLWDPRNLIASTPALALAAGWLLSRPRPRIAALATALVLGGFAVSAAGLLSRERQRPDYIGAAQLAIADGSPRSPIAVIAAPTGGPPSAMDAALAGSGQPGRGVLRIGSPQLSAIVRAPPYAPLAPTPSAVLAQAAARVPHGTRLFVVVPGTASLAELLGHAALDPQSMFGPVLGGGKAGTLMAATLPPLSGFLRDILPAFRPVRTSVFPGVFRISEYEFVRR